MLDRIHRAIYRDFLIINQGWDQHKSEETGEIKYSKNEPKIIKNWNYLPSLQGGEKLLSSLLTLLSCPSCLL